MRVLVVEDDAEFAEVVGAGLRRHGMAVDIALDGPSGLERALIKTYDVVVLDRDLPGMRGDQVCQQLVAERRPCRVMMVTAAPASRTGSAGSLLAPTTTCPSRSRSPN